MTSPFEKPYQGVAYFGVWASETAGDYGRRAAVTVLAGAVDCCADDDMRRDGEVAAALDYLTANGHGKAARRFRKALDVQHPDEPQAAAGDAVPGRY